MMSLNCKIFSDKTNMGDIDGVKQLANSCTDPHAAFHNM